MTHFPLFADLKDQPCLVIGGGEVAARKVGRLLQASARVTVNAPQLGPELAARAAAQEVRHVEGEFDPKLISSHLLIIAATADRDVNRRVAETAATHQRLCNVVDDRELSSCILPAVVDRAPIVIAVGSNGQSPVLARRLRQQIEAWLPDRIGELADWAGGWRDAVREHIDQHAGRLRFWENLFDGEPARLVLAGRRREADALVISALDRERQNQSAGHGKNGVAWIVGAGPGDPGLLTRRGLQLLEQADVVMHDRLVGKPILEFARRDARLIDVGKSPGGPASAQENINDQLVALVAAGNRVCRLKGGDPFVFGRGAEEVAAVATAGLAYEVVPGITAAIGCSAAAGIALTRRGLTGAVTMITAHRAPETDDDIDWALLAQTSHTLVIYMGVKRLPEISDELIRHGMSASMPAAVIENGATDAQRVIGGQLGDIANRAKAAAAQPPALLIVGDVVGVADRIDWLAIPDTDLTPTAASA
jgi:uroporphyrin-III C-methyltransferase/precorrin-2 dehydrogenase/sirohydrochlorin ferrochelatase